jgi:hypothetical protein
MSDKLDDYDDEWAIPYAPYMLALRHDNIKEERYHVITYNSEMDWYIVDTARRNNYAKKNK